MTQNLGAAGLHLYADTAQYQADLGKAAATAEREMRRIQRESQMASAIVSELGRRMNSTATTTESAWGRHSAATSKARGDLQATERSTAAARQQMQQLNYQISDIAVGLSTGQSPFMVLMQQGGQLRDQYGSVAAAGAALGRGVLAMINPFTAVAAAVGFVGYQMYQGSEETKEFRRQVELTGNYAAMTEARLRNMAEAMTLSKGGNVADNRETVSTLAGSGVIPASAMNEASAAMAAYRRITGDTGAEALKIFSGISSGAAKWAAEQNRSMHFLTAAQYQHLKSLEDTGHGTQAMREALSLMAGELERRHTPQVGYLASAWKGVAEWAGAAKRAMMDWGKPDELADQIDKLRKKLASDGGKWADGVQPKGQTETEAYARWKAQMDGGRERLRELLNIQAREQSARDEAAKKAVTQQDKIDELQQPKTGAKTDYLGNEETAWRKRWDDWWQRDQAKRDQADMAPDYLGEADGAIQAKWDDWANKNADAMDKAEQRLIRGNGTKSAASAWWADWQDAAQRGAAEFTTAMQGMEDAVVNWARTGKLSVGDFFASMGEMYLREMTKMAAAKLFYDGDGNFTGMSGLMSLGSAFLGFFANGLSTVPADGPAYLHAGERVLTKQEAAAYSSGGGKGGGGGTSIDNSGQTFNIGQGVSRGEVTAGVQQAVAASEARMWRQLRMKGVV